MKPTFQQKMDQRLVMSTQLQQTIRLLQLSTLDLQREIQEALDSNPMLETEEGTASDAPSAADELTTTGESERIDRDRPEESPAAEFQENTSPESQENLSSDEIEQEYVHSEPPSAATGDHDPTALYHAPTSLSDHLEWQLDLSPLTDRDKLIGHAIVDALDDSGYLNVSLDELLTPLKTQLEGVELDEIQAVQRYIRHLDPTGCASQNLQECLLSQLDELPEKTPFIQEAYLLVNRHLVALGERNLSQLMRNSRLSERQVNEAMSIIRQLNPKPGHTIEDVSVPHIIPDLTVKKSDGVWSVSLNSESLPKVRINNSYAKLIRKQNAPADNDYMKSCLQEARWLLKSVENRNSTLLRVAALIVNHQQAFFDDGEQAMRPLGLADIASAVEMHESTVSRVTTQKFIHTPKGLFELKYFFSNAVRTGSENDQSSLAIKAQIKQLITEEPTRKPLSDNKIVKLLGERGVNIARRTVAKYRESLNIPPSSERKQLL